MPSVGDWAAATIDLRSSLTSILARLTHSSVEWLGGGWEEGRSRLARFRDAAAAKLVLLTCWRNRLTRFLGLGVWVWFFFFFFVS
ncbi:MAG: hypothetical protein ACKERG_00040 [Candidatus Hodgkinia cicadicola]